MSIQLSKLNLVSDNSSDGERWLLRVADALESGNMPTEDDIERMIDAAALLKAQIQEKEKPEHRRQDLLRKLQFMKAGHREADQNDYKGKVIAQAYWLDVLWTGNGVNQALEFVAGEHEVSPDHVRMKRDRHIEEGRNIFNLMKGVIPEDHPNWRKANAMYQRIANRLKK